MKNSLERFNYFFSTFKQTPLWRSMLLTREDSPWHREENVAVHTSMVIDWYMNNLYSSRHEVQRLYTLVCCLFHDVGKSQSEVVKYKEDRGVYRAYHGHELISARLWVDYAMSNLDVVQNTLRFSLTDISNIALFIEHHVPFSMKDEKKLKNLKQSILKRTGEIGHSAWIDFLRSDQHGRIADEQPKKLKEVEDWLSKWSKL